MRTTHQTLLNGTLLYWIFVVVCIAGTGRVGLSTAWAFQFISPSNGEVVEAGRRLEIRVDPGEDAPLFGILFMASRGISPPKLDSTPPYVWSIQIPKSYVGNLTLWAVARRYTPVPNPPRATVTIKVVRPIIHATLPESTASWTIEEQTIDPILLRPDRGEQK
ncbi:MAG: hypothetical protein ABGX83_08320 [Nitrospira sp.]|nr:hypothetical protein [Candidatus Manganitrophaceae bacterium]HIL34188.1 hypothetical protein [Candidatus Manganitrophaceae bacterium]